MWLHSLKVAQLLRSAACLHTNQSRSYLNHLVVKMSHIIGITMYHVTNVTLKQGGGVITMGEMRNAYRILAYVV